MLYEKIKIYLANNNVSVEDLTRKIIFKEDVDENGAYINEWNIAEIERPTQEQLDEISEDDILLNDAKNTKNNEVELLRKSYQFQPISYQGSEFSTSQMARQNITAILVENSFSENHYWKDINETAFDFTLDDFKAISKLISGRDTKLYYIEAQIINEIKSLDLASIQSLNIIDSWQIHEANY